MATVEEPARATTWPAGLTESRGGGKAFLLGLFMFACLIPINLYLGEFRVDPYRLVLLAMFIPAAAYVCAGRAGFVTTTDMLMIGFGLWIMVTLIHHHGQWGFINGSITVVELVGAYMLGRMLVRSTEDYRRYIRFFLISLLILLPFALHEFLTGRWLIGEALGRIFNVPGYRPIGARFGFSRARVAFSHPILFGVYCSIGLANVYYLYRRHIPKAALLVVFVTAMTFSSVSSGPFLAVMVQLGIVAWGLVMRENWRALLIVAVIGYVTIDMLSNRGPILIFLETFTFSSQTVWSRIHIFNYGSAEVLRNPILGIGFNDYERPRWLTSSVDNYWLLTALRHGLVGFLLLAGGLLLQLWRIVRAESLSDGAKAARLGYMVTFVGLAFSLSTVHLWNSIASVVFFFFGAGAFLYTADNVRAEAAAGPASETGAASPATAPRAASSYRRPPPPAMRPPDPAPATRAPAPAAPARPAAPLRRTPAEEAAPRTDSAPRYRR